MVFLKRISDHRDSLSEQGCYICLAKEMEETHFGRASKYCASCYLDK